ncbi:MAG TPA: diaminopimelate epimerase [Pseudonocardiaceae bacterium]
MGVRFAKGHGTENDFVLLPDPDGLLDLTASRVRALCDRRRGIGADGVLRMLHGSDGRPGGDGWFMDYRNADGSVAEMCGNGVRVFARYLVDAGLVPAGEFVIGTRNGPRAVMVSSAGEVTVDMGSAVVQGSSTAIVAGRAFPGLVIDVGNPHLACVTDGQLSDLDLTVPPGHDPVVFPDGVNVEFVRITGADATAMRVHERGVGETRSCGTGTVAAAVAALWAGGRSTGELSVDTRGGRLRVEVEASTTRLTGPAVIVAAGELSDDWWQES